MLKRKTYSREYKIGAIQMVDQKGMTMREVSEALGINDGMLWRWRKEYKEGKLQSFPGNGRMSDKDAEIARLRQENRRLQAERDILKKATALFARPM
ncbi:transposase [bacterium]|jgi:transposase|nr:transposase [bacterium]